MSGRRPLFEVKTLDGKDLRLIDYRGKFVLFYFWSPRTRTSGAASGNYTRPTAVQVGSKSPVWEALGTLEQIRQCVAENPVEWPEIYVGDGSGMDEGPVGRYVVDYSSRLQLVTLKARSPQTGILGRADDRRGFQDDRERRHTGGLV